jgi:hypothetical protein
MMITQFDVFVFTAVTQTDVKNLCTNKSCAHAIYGAVRTVYGAVRIVCGSARTVYGDARTVYGDVPAI